MKANPIYEFKATTDLGVDMVPVGALILIEDSDGAGTPRLLRKTSQGALVSTSTIADFLATVGATEELFTESVTALSVNANVLTFVDETGASTNIDLSVYIDDTNLARLVGGTLDAATGIATFTRDDTTTFTIDMSSLLPATDNLKITDANQVVSASNKVATMADVSGVKSTLSETSFVATANQTVFVISNIVFDTTLCEVYVNRLRSRKNEYTVINDGVNTTITLTNTSSQNDMVDVVIFI